MSFQFRWQSVLQIRHRHRDIERQELAAVQTEYEKCVAERNQLTNARMAVIHELRLLNDCDLLDVGKLNEWRHYAEGLAQALISAETHVAAARSKLEHSRKRLIAADQAAQAMEHLAERQFDEFQQCQTRMEQRELNDFTNSRRRVAG